MCKYETGTSSKRFNWLIDPHRSKRTKTKTCFGLDFITLLLIEKYLTS